MLRTISRVLFHPRKPTTLKWNGKVKPYSQTQNENSMRVVVSSAATPQTNVKDYSLSHKVLEYMRGSHEYASSPMSSSEESYVTDDTVVFRRQQLAHALAHSPQPKPDDILEVFSHYALEDQNIIQDIINKKDFMSMIRERVFLVIPLMSQDELRKLASILRKLNFERSRYLISIVEKVGQECVDRAAEADLEQSLELFDIVLLLHGNRVYRKKQFDTFISYFESHVMTTATPHQLVQVLHYIGIAKKHKLNQESVQYIIRELEEVVEHLSFIDLGIAVGGMFKCNVKLNKSSPIIQKSAEWLQVKAKDSKGLTDLEYFAFIAMIKVIRAAKYHDQALMSSISSFVTRCEVDTLNHTVIAHLLSLYANLQVYDQQVFTKLEQLMLHELTRHTVAVRVKDISKIMWSFSHVGHQITDDFLHTVEKVLLKSLHMGQLDQYPEHLSSSLFSMAVMQRYPNELIKEAFHPHRTIKLRGYQRSKHLSRLVALHRAVKIEIPTIDVSLPEIPLSDLPKRTLADEMLYRPPLAHLKKGADFINRSIGASVLELKFPIPLINYASLVFDTRRLKKSTADGNLILQQLLDCKSCVGERSIAIDLVDSQSLLIGREEDVIGILRMKLRLLTKSGWLVQRIYEDDVTKFNIDEHTMGAFILDILSKFQNKEFNALDTKYTH